MSNWHYQLMYHKYDEPVLGEEGYYAVHEYYPMSEKMGGDGWTEEPVDVTGNSIEDVKKMLMMIYNDIDKHGLKDFD